jgi:hypothetical protein
MRRPSFAFCRRFELFARVQAILAVGRARRGLTEQAAFEAELIEIEVVAFEAVPEG